MNHNEDVYSEADSFVPERWIRKERQIGTFNPFAFPVFQGGPRICLGKDLSIYETKVLLVEIVRKFRFELVAEKYRRAMRTPGWRKDVTLIDGNPVYKLGLTLFFGDDLDLKFYNR